ncbi:MAG: hypothetical protein QXG52_03725 [Candidatus Caldarchaeum sp.]
MPSHGKQRRKQFSMWKIKTFIDLTLLTIAAIAVTTIPQNPFTPQTSETTPTFIIYRTETCSCCREYESYLRKQKIEFKTMVVDHVELEKIREKFGIPP